MENKTLMQYFEWYLPENGLPGYTVFREIAEKEFLASLRQMLGPDQAGIQPAEMKMR